VDLPRRRKTGRNSEGELEFLFKINLNKHKPTSKWFLSLAASISGLGQKESPSSDSTENSHQSQNY